MASTLETLSIELVEMIVFHLEPDDIKSLRLTNRLVEQKTSQGRFATFFTSKDVELTPTCLQDMVSVTQGGHLGRRLRHCTITGIAKYGVHSEEDEREAKHCLSLLSQSFINLRSETSGIDTLCLRVAAVMDRKPDDDPSLQGKFRDWKAIWKSAVSTFNMTTTALAESQLIVYEHLDVFGSLKGCGLDCSVFRTFAQSFTVSTRSSFHRLKWLTLSLSASHVTRLAYGKKGLTEAEIQASQNHPSDILQLLPRLLQTMPDIEGLELKWLYVTDGNRIWSVPPMSHSDYNSVDAPTMVRLKNCTLRGISIPPEKLLQFLDAVHPIVLTLEYVYTSDWVGIFKYLTDPGNPITRYHLENLHQNKQLVHYEEPPGRYTCVYLNGIVGKPIILARSMDCGAQEAIPYHLTDKKLRHGSRYKGGWPKSKGYGLFSESDYDFIALNPMPSSPDVKDPVEA